MYTFGTVSDGSRQKKIKEGRRERLHEGSKLKGVGDKELSERKHMECLLHRAFAYHVIAIVVCWH